MFDVDSEIDKSPLYTHPTIRSERHEYLLNRLQQIRDRRLVTALQYESARVDKLQRLNATLSAQYEKVDERNRLDLVKVDELIDKLERGISKQIELAHKLTLTEE